MELFTRKVFCALFLNHDYDEDNGDATSIRMSIVVAFYFRAHDAPTSSFLSSELRMQVQEVAGCQ